MGVEARLTEVNSRHVVISTGLVSAVFLLAGVAIQDWTSPAGQLASGNPWGTLMTASALCVEAAAMAVVAPLGDGHLRTCFTVAFALESLGWLCGVVLFQRFSPLLHGFTQEWLVKFAVAAIGIAGIWRVYIAIVAAKRAGYLKDLPDGSPFQKHLMWGFGCMTLAYLLCLALYQSFPLPGIILAVLKQVLTCLLLVLVGFLARQKTWTTAVLGTFFLAFVLEQANPLPFSTSRLFHTTALVNTVLMLHMSATYGLLVALVDAKTATVESAESPISTAVWPSPKAEVDDDFESFERMSASRRREFERKLEEKLSKSDRRCCDRGGGEASPDSWYKNCIGTRW